MANGNGFVSGGTIPGVDVSEGLQGLKDRPQELRDIFSQVLAVAGLVFPSILTNTRVGFAQSLLAAGDTKAQVEQARQDTLDQIAEIREIFETTLGVTLSDIDASGAARTAALEVNRERLLGDLGILREEVVGGLEERLDRNLGRISGLGEQERRQIRADFRGLAESGALDATARGFSGSTSSAIRLAAQRGETEALGGLEERLRQQLTDTDILLSGDVLSAEARFGAANVDLDRALSGEIVAGEAQTDSARIAARLGIQGDFLAFLERVEHEPPDFNQNVFLNQTLAQLRAEDAAAKAGGAAASGNITGTAIAAGGAFLGTEAGAAATTAVVGGVTAAAGGLFAGAGAVAPFIPLVFSDRNGKFDVIPTDEAEVLQRLRTLEVSEWSYRGQEETHIGPMAQDFKGAFGYGASDTTIAVVDGIGVSLAAIKALLNRVELLETELKSLRVGSLCVGEDSRVAVRPNGGKTSWVALKDVRLGDRVLDSEKHFSPVEGIALGPAHGDKKHLAIFTEHGHQLILTEDHLVGGVKAGDLKAGSKIRCICAEMDTVKSVVEVPPIPGGDLVLESRRGYFAEGIEVECMAVAYNVDDDVVELTKQEA